jgi:hypothetical protein
MDDEPSSEEETDEEKKALLAQLGILQKNQNNSQSAVNDVKDALSKIHSLIGSDEKKCTLLNHGGTEIPFLTFFSSLLITFRRYFGISYHFEDFLSAEIHRGKQTNRNVEEEREGEAEGEEKLFLMIIFFFASSFLGTLCDSS